MREDAIVTLLVSDRKTSRYLLFDPETMRLVGWTNVTTGEVRSPYEDLDMTKCLKLAFSGIHIMSDMVFAVLDEYAREKYQGVSAPLYDTHANDRSPRTQFQLIDRGNGLVSLKCMDGRYIKVS